MPWNDTTKIATAPLSIGDISKAVGYTSGDLGTVIRKGAQYNLINKWAVFKPVRYPSPAALTRAQRASVNFGLSAPSPVANNPVSTFGHSWPYAPPRGKNGGDNNEDEWFRKLDFDDYNREATCPVIPPGDIDIQISTTADFSFGSVIGQNPSGGDSISIEELPVSLGNYYLCAVFAKNVNFTGDLLAKTSTNKISSNGVVLDITHAELSLLQSSGYAYYYLVARSVALTSLSSPSTNTANYIALPAPNNSNDLRGLFTIRAAAIASAVLTGVSISQTPTRVQNFIDASSYVGPESVPAVASDYLNVSTSPYWLHLKFHIKAGDSSLTILNPKVTLSRTFNSINGFARKIGCTLYDSSFVSRAQIVIPANDEQDIYLVAESPILGLDQAGREGRAAADQYFTTTVRLYNGETLIDATNELRVRNYSF